MARKCFTKEQIITILKEAEWGAKVADVLRRFNIAEATFYRWKSLYGCLSLQEARLLLESTQLPKRDREVLLFITRFLSGRLRLAEIADTISPRGNPADLKVLYSHALGPYCRKKVRACVIILSWCGLPKSLMTEAFDVTYGTIKHYLGKYARAGLAGLFTTPKKVRKYEDARYKEALFTILHSPPRDHGFNRTSWCRQDLYMAMARHGLPIAMNGIDRIIGDAGYRFIKARKVLTSHDEHYREKVNHVRNILRRLKPTERFFSIDEFGPVSIKEHTGRRLVGPNEHPTVPQFQKSRGRLIVTAALELSENQVTHFYSNQKNTAEMIKLLDVLLVKYCRCTTIYLSWDAAGWHSSKRFEKKAREVNAPCYRRAHKTPKVKLVPLPAHAQFLNVIESVFSGLAKAIIHNSNYVSVDEAKDAIDRYFADRNAHFRANPKRCGSKIWGQERVADIFKEGQNCKDANFR